jgi:hypothetical protein
MRKRDIKLGMKVRTLEGNGYFPTGTICVVDDISGETCTRVKGKTNSGRLDSWWLNNGEFEFVTIKEKLVDGQHVIYRNGKERIYNESAKEFRFSRGALSMDLASYNDDLKCIKGMNKSSWDVVEIFTPEKVTTIEKVVHYKEIRKVTQADVNDAFGETVEVIA